VPNGARETQMRGAPAAAPSSGGRAWVDAVRATMKSNVACYELHSPLAASARLPDGSVRFIADELLRTLANDAGSRGAEVPHCLCTEAARTGGWLERLGFGPLRPIAGFVLPSDDREVWLPMSLLNRDVNAARPCGFVLFGDWLDLPNVDGMPGSGDSRPVLLFDSAPKNIVLRVPRSIEQLRREVGALADQCKLQGLAVVRGRLGRTDVNSYVFCSLRSESSSGERTAWMSSRPNSLTLKPNGDPGTVGLGADSTNQRLVRFQLDDQLPDDTVSVDAATWRDLTFDASSSHAMPAGAMPFHLMRIPAVQWPQAQRILAERGFDVALEQPIVETRLQRVRVTARDRKEDAADDELVSCVSQAHPTFVFALPELSLDGHAANRKVRFHASTPLDPTRFQAPPVAGSWLNGDSRSIVLPASMAEMLFPRQTPRQSLGQAVRIGFSPLQPLGPADLLELEFTVVGWTDSNDGFLSLDTAKTLDLWRRGRLHYDADEEAFVTLRARSARLGALRSAIDVEDVDQIEGVVRRLEEQGWRTENSLSARAGLWRLLQVLVGAVVLFSLGCWLLSILLVGATAMINVSAKVWEIGVLKALGMTNGAIARVYWLQGIMLGCVGFLVGSVAAVVLERVTSKVLHSMFGLSGSLDGDRLASPQWAWLFATAFVACLFASSLAMWLPARRSASLDPVEAMRHRS
ncbi:MAG TPA: FtsX-like permease family protein, partial [Pirellulaceae bacterium]|nr:FtsX-like permease family protein [Pirellulaceae bacterium]